MDGADVAAYVVVLLECDFFSAEKSRRSAGDERFWIHFFMCRDCRIRAHYVIGVCVYLLEFKHSILLALFQLNISQTVLFFHADLVFPTIGCRHMLRMFIHLEWIKKKHRQSSMIHACLISRAFLRFRSKHINIYTRPFYHTCELYTEVTSS